MFLALAAFCLSVDPPSAWGPVPNEYQLRYHREELAAFIHYGMNTFTGKEWGDGKEDPNSFRPTNLNTDQWVEVLQKSGFKRIIIVGKHHDGFCNWKTKYSTHQVNASKDFQSISALLHQSGDIIEELSKSCTKYNMDMGLYLSPWDVNSPYYGDDILYNQYYMNQLEEILNSENKKYGNNGKFVEIWMDGAKGEGQKAQNYWFLKWFDLIYKHQPDQVIFSSYGSEIRWVGNEAAVAGVPCWNKFNNTDMRSCYDKKADCYNQDSNHGDPNGPDYQIAECDVSLTSGWFWKAGKVPKSSKEISSIYFTSVGRGQPLLLNVPPDTEGKIPDNFVEALNEFTKTRTQSFSHDFARQSGVTVQATSFRGSDDRFRPENVLDESDETYWTMDDGQTTGSITIDLGEYRTFDLISIQEHIQLGQRISKFKIEVHKKSTGENEWTLFDESQTIGYRHLSRSNQVTADKVRVTIVESQAVPLIQSIGIFKAVGSFAFDDDIPEGLTFIDSKTFSTTEKWTTEDEGIWTKVKGGSASTSFTGTRFYITGILDPGHGDMDVYVDDRKVATVNCKSATRKLRQVLYVSDEVSLSYDKHTVKVVCASEAIAIHSLLYLDNNAQGMFEIASSEYSVNEGQTVTVEVRRVGGYNKKATVTFQTAPGTAVHGKNYEDVTKTLVFEAGDSEPQFIDVKTIYHQEPTGDLNFYAEIVDPTDGAITGFNHSSVVNIIDIQKVKKLEMKNDSSMKKLFSNTLAFYVLGAVVALCAAVAIVLIIINNKRSSEQDPTPLNNVDEKVYTK
ncbi:hypothetical protein M9Y10_000811 [Tritrichomonas musculus]|uniref:alpha-L-fucosidase n=1 Tax=Tritrichomonas musculus TaxID=1915356 RepID=A0ABR2L8D0_9EUKA